MANSCIPCSHAHVCLKAPGAFSRHLLTWSGNQTCGRASGLALFPPAGPGDFPFPFFGIARSCTNLMSHAHLFTLLLRNLRCRYTDIAWRVALGSCSMAASEEFHLTSDVSITVSWSPLPSPSPSSLIPPPLPPLLLPSSCVCLDGTLCTRCYGNIV